jgi:hypothetical protein
LLYHNDGGGAFSRASGGSVTNQLGYFGPCVFGDYDNDGFLDLFVANHDALDQTGVKNLLFHNNGDGTFSKVTAGSVVNDVGVAFGALWADYDNDGFMDLLVVNNRLANSHNFLYHNNRDGTFTRILTNAIATDSWPVGAQGGAWGDYDNDGLLDLFVTDSAGVRNHLYHNNGNGAFTNVTSGPMLRAPAIGCSWGDYDNDGYLDLFVSDYGGSNALFHNNGDGTFIQIFSGDPVHSRGGASCCWVDYDNDGFLDLFLTGGEPGPLPSLLFHNNGNSNAWLEVKCVGTVANRSAIGAKVRVHATIGGKAFWQLREISNGGDGTANPRLRISAWATPPTWTRCASNGPREPSRNSKTCRQGKSSALPNHPVCWRPLQMGCLSSSSRPGPACDSTFSPPQTWRLGQPSRR